MHVYFSALTIMIEYRKEKSQLKKLNLKNCRSTRGIPESEQREMVPEGFPFFLSSIRIVFFVSGRTRGCSVTAPTAAELLD
jgi:hypothetical protein